MELEAVYGGPAVHKTSTENPAELLIGIMEKNPHARREELMQMFRKVMAEAITEEPAYLVPLADRYFYHEYNNIVSYRRRALQRDRPKGPAERRRELEDTKAAIRRVIVLDLVLPNGKKARESTFADCKKAGGFWLKIANKGKPNQIVGKVLTDEQAQAIWAR